MLADAVSFAISGVVVALIRGREPQPEPSHTRKRDELVEGLRYVFSQPFLRTLRSGRRSGISSRPRSSCCSIIYFVKVLHWGPDEDRLLTALSTSGFVIGALVNERVVARLGPGRLIAFSGIASSALLLGDPAAPLSHPLP